MWERTRRLFASIASHHSSTGYCELDAKSVNEDGEGYEDDDEAGMSDLEYDDKSIHQEYPVSVRSHGSTNGFEVQSTIGGTPNATPSKKMEGLLKISAVGDVDAGDNSDSDLEDIIESAEQKPFVRD